MKNILVPVALVLLGGMVSAKLPPLDDAAKAKAAEAAAKAAWQAKVDAYKLCKAQDRVAAAYGKSGGKQSNSAAVQPVSTAATAAASAPAAAAAASAPAKSASAPAAAASASPGTPVASAAPPPCVEPGPFAYNAPEQKPLETSGAHSPSGTAASPPSVKPNSGEMKPAR